MRWKKLAHDALDQEGEQPILWPDETPLALARTSESSVTSLQNAPTIRTKCRC